MKTLDLVFVGFGNVGREVSRLLWSGREEFARQGLIPRAVAIVTRRHGTLVDEGGIDLLAAASGDRFPGCAGALDIVTSVKADVVLELTTLDARSGQPAISHVEAALRSGKHVVSANKGPVAWAYHELSEIAQHNRRMFLFESSVMDGTPVFNLARHCLRECRVTAFEGVLNSTANFVLDEIAVGRSLADAVAEAQRRGVAEADPSMDIDGWDSAAKVAALANVFMGARTNPLAVSRVGIGDITRQDFDRAARRGETIKLVCRASVLPDPGSMMRMTVAPEQVPRESLLGMVRGTSSVLILRTDLMGDIGIVEQDPSLRQTAYGVIADLMEIARQGSFSQ
jgi:homoserine dehydrogenase